MFRHDIFRITIQINSLIGTILTVIAVMAIAGNCFSPTQLQARTIIEAQVVRNEKGPGNCLISSGFPVPEGLVTEQTIKAGEIKVVVDGTEVPANVSALRGRHHDDTLRSMLIQFHYSMEENQKFPAQVIIEGGVRSSPDPDYQRPTLEIVKNNNVIFPTGADYLTSAGICMRNLLPVGQGSASEEKLYTDLAEDRFDWLIERERYNSVYEPASAVLGLWSRSGGEIKYWNGALDLAMHYLPRFTPDPCDPGEGPWIANPDKRTDSNGLNRIPMTENQVHMIYSYAQMYLLTGYRDFWGIVAVVNVQQQKYNQTEEDVYERIPTSDQYDHPRFSHAWRYGALVPGYMIDALIHEDLQDWNPAHWRKSDWATQIDRVLNALIETKWDIQWIPFENGNGTVPLKGTIISQGDVNAKFLTVGKQKYAPYVASGESMPSTGYIQIDKSTITGGSFDAGNLNGISATAKGSEEDDYRNGIIGTRSWTKRDEPNPVFQFSAFPMNFLIDYYLYVEADSRIPDLVKTWLDVFLSTTKILEDGDYGYDRGSETWGYPTWGSAYDLTNPIKGTKYYSPWQLPIAARLIPFVLKTHGIDETVNGKRYSEWYEILINTANVNPDQVLTWQWRHFGQVYGWNQDAPWMMQKDSLTNYGPSNIRSPKQYNEIPGEDPDIKRESNDVLHPPS